MKANNNYTLLEERTDEQLMQEVANGNIDMLRFLFERHSNYVYNFLYKMCGNKILSEDLTQEVFYNLVRYRSSYNGGKFVSWMFAIAANSLSSYNKKKDIEYQNIDCLTDELVETSIEINQDYSHLHNALNQLSPNDRQLITLNRLNGIKYKELAVIMNNTPGAVKIKVYRALEKLRTIYFEKYIK